MLRFRKTNNDYIQSLLRVEIEFLDSNATLPKSKGHI